MEKVSKGLIGIFQIRCTKTDIRYIGSSASMSNALIKHARKLVKHAHTNGDLQRAWNENGAEAFEFSVLEIVADKNALRVREGHWLELENTIPIESALPGLKYAMASTHISVSKELKEEIRHLSPETIAGNIQMLLQFYKDHNNSDER